LDACPDCRRRHAPRSCEVERLRQRSERRIRIEDRCGLAGLVLQTSEGCLLERAKPRAELSAIRPHAGRRPPPVNKFNTELSADV
jgi:hypothetical protein